MTKDPSKIAKRSRTREVMANLFRDGKTLREVATVMGCTTQNVSWCLKQHGVEASEGGQAKTMREIRADRASEIARRRDAASLKKNGCDYATYTSLRLRPDRPRNAFREQKNHALYRGIGWHLNFWQWWSIWQESGKWELRGPGQGYCMCRNLDLGAYEEGNVFIATIRENSSREHAKASGLPLGVYMEKGQIKAVRMIARKSIKLGVFRTAELAHQAYLNAGKGLS